MLLLVCYLYFYQPALVFDFCLILADQTPTPTRFIKYGEEVGLFQDLQNVNPFEEQFKKATYAVKMGEAPLQVC